MNDDVVGVIATRFTRDLSFTTYQFFCPTFCISLLICRCICIRICMPTILAKIHVYVEKKKNVDLKWSNIIAID